MRGLLAGSDGAGAVSAATCFHASRMLGTQPNHFFEEQYRSAQRGLHRDRKHRGLEFAQHLRRPAADIHAQTRLEVDKNSLGPLDGDSATAHSPSKESG
jgi:hypothetical protein